MRTYVDQRYLEERERFGLMATCEYCQHFDPPSGECSMKYPTEPHREALHQAAQDGDAVFYCKYFTVD